MKSDFEWLIWIKLMNVGADNVRQKLRVDQWLMDDGIVSEKKGSMKDGGEAIWQLISWLSTKW